MTTKTAPIQTISTRLIGRWEQTAGKLATLAEEFPEKEYEFKPADGIRTVGEVLRHVAFWNQYVAGIARGEKPDDTSNELSKAEYATKAQTVRALQRSAADAADALKAHQPELAQELAETVVTFIEHTSEHYGQLVVYARLQEIVPPSSCG
ncbi:DinB-like domain protein [Candidatus Sulfopaludibacter sp. SbA3]|nr:DinB-like domain protein [Candidatus Sulfopaludibacter sp. SbA3]